MRLFFFSLLLLFTTAAFSQDSIHIAAGTNDLDRYTIFFKGEFHDRPAENEPSLLLLAKHLYAHNNVRYLVLEWGPDFSYLANRYLQTQDNSILFKDTLVFSKAFWDALISHNRSRPVVDQLKINGFDFNRSVFTGRAFFLMTKDKAPFPDAAVQSALQKLIEWKSIRWTWEGQEKFTRQLDELRSLCNKQEAALKTYFGEDWPAFSSIVNHDVDSKKVVTRDKKTIKYVNAFLETKEAGGVLFNGGISHAFLNGVGIGKMLKNDPKYGDKVCSIYPYYQLPPGEKSKIQQRKDSYLPVDLLAELENFPSYALVNVEQRGLYPKTFKIGQWVYVIPKVRP